MRYRIFVLDTRWDSAVCKFYRETFPMRVFLQRLKIRVGGPPHLPPLKTSNFIWICFSGLELACANLGASTVIA